MSSEIVRFKVDDWEFESYRDDYDGEIKWWFLINDECSTPVQGEDLHDGKEDCLREAIGQIDKRIAALTKIKRGVMAELAKSKEA